MFTVYLEVHWWFKIKSIKQNYLSSITCNIIQIKKFITIVYAKNTVVLDTNNYHKYNIWRQALANVHLCLTNCVSIYNVYLT